MREEETVSVLRGESTMAPFGNAFNGQRSAGGIPGRDVPGELE